MKVLKFGGSSFSSPDGLLKAKKIIESNKVVKVVVVSAFEGVTDKLKTMAMFASERNAGYKTIYSEIEHLHKNFVTSVLSSSTTSTVLSDLTELFKQLEELVEGVFLLHDITPKILDKIIGFGYLFSARILAEMIPDAEYLNVSCWIKTDNKSGSTKVDIPKTYQSLKENLDQVRLAIVPGGIASDDNGNITALGRDGSNFSAAIIATALDAQQLEIWTNADGFMTADPARVTKAFAIERMTYSEAMELSHFGASVIYTPAIQPVLQKNIPIVIKNTFNPALPGTLISDKASDDDSSLIKGVSSIDSVDLITIQGPGMVGVNGISGRLFGALAHEKINIILITQASSEYSISFAVIPEHTGTSVKAVENEFESEIKLHKAINIMVEKELSVIAIVGERMKNTPGISATLFRSLGRNGISVIATAQGSSELNISVVIKKESLKKALNVIHEGFFLSHVKELHLYIVGVGTVGSSLINQIKHQQEKLLNEHKLKINVVGICRSKKMIVTLNGINLDNYQEEIQKGKTADIHKFIERIRTNNLRNSVLIDCTAEESIAATYMDVLNSYVSVVAANKIACSSDLSQYKELKKIAQEKNVKLLIETNVGAGLPIISTINDLIKSGDKILKLEAVLSGTLNFIFNVLSENISLSKAVRLAMEKGFSEPDPRIDLSGVDVIRKLLILARESGYNLEEDDIQVNPFLPSSCFEGSLDNFWTEVEKQDKIFEEKRKQLAAQSKKWRFIAMLENGRGSVSLQEVDSHHPASRLEGSNNIILITTERYQEEPMIIRGYGAGAEVTAAGVFADVIRVANI